jgi:hypothetical protein
MKEINLNDIIKDKIKDCHNSSAIFNTKKYVLLEDALECMRIACEETLMLAAKNPKICFHDKKEKISGRQYTCDMSSLHNGFKHIIKVDKESILKIKNYIK